MHRSLLPSPVSIPVLLALLALAPPASSAPPVTQVTNADIPRDNVKGPALNFERAQLQPLEFSSDGTRLYVVNSQGARLAAFDVATGEHVLDIPVGISAVSVARRPGTEELWVVDSIASTVFVVDPGTASIVRSVRVGNEPHGIAFTPSGDRAYVTCSGVNRVDVVDGPTVALIQSIAVPVEQPRGIVWTAGHAWVAPMLSGNNSAPYGLASDPDHIVGVAKVTAAGLNPLPDRDLLAIATQTDPKQDALDPSLTRTGLGTVLFGVSQRPGTSELWIPNTDALNTEFKGERSFIAGQVVSNRITVVDLQSAAPPVVIDLDALAPPDERLAMPTHVEFDASGQRAYVSGYGTDIVGVLDLQPGGGVSWAGTILLTPHQPFPAGAGPRQARIDPSGARLFVFQRIGNALSTVELASIPPSVPFFVRAPQPQLLGFNSMTGEERHGRHLFNNARFSKSMTSACGSCHVEAHADGLTWDLSAYLDPEGTPMGQLSFPVDSKGAMVTKNLRRKIETGPYHWRGEVSRILDFNADFVNLLENQVNGVASEISSMAYIMHYINNLCWPPNPNTPLDRDYTPAQLAGADLFMNKQVFGFMTCADCHQLPLGTSSEIVTMLTDGVVVSSDIPALRGVTDKLSPPHYIGGRFGSRTELGAGFTHGGALARLRDVHLPGTLLNLTPQEADQIAAFVEALDWGLAPATGFAATAHAGNIATFPTTELAFLEDQAERGNCDLVYMRAPLVLPGGQGLIHRAGRYDPQTKRYLQATRWSSGLTQAQVLADVAAGLPVTFLGVPLGMGQPVGMDRDMDTLLDLDEYRLGCDLEEFDTDDDGFPDGWEVRRNMDPTVPDAKANDTQPPALVGPVKVHWASTTTIKLEFDTTELARVYVAYNGEKPVQRLPLGPPNFDTHHDTVLGGLKPGTSYNLELLLFDPANNTILDASNVVQTRPLLFGQPACVGGIELRLSPAGTNQLGVMVHLAEGDKPAGSGYVVEGSVYQLFVGGAPAMISPSISGTTGASGTAHLQASLPPPGVPSTLVFVIKDVQPPGGAPHYVPSLNAQKSAGISY